VSSVGVRSGRSTAVGARREVLLRSPRWRSTFSQAGAVDSPSKSFIAAVSVAVHSARGVFRLDRSSRER
jgi:hypothetical protein